jgi:MFS family permease
MRVVVTAAHLALWVVSGALYFLFVLPRWWELMGDTSHTVGTVLRIVTGVLIALAALPVLLTLLRSRRPELGTPQLALRLRVWSMVLYVLAGVLIVGAAVAEIWVSLDKGGRWLFGIYGAAAAIAILALLAFSLARTAELPAKAPKPKKDKKKRDETAEADEVSSDEPDEPDEPAAADEVEETAAADETAAVEDEQPAEVSAEAEPEPEPDDESSGGLRNKRPTGKTNHRLRRRNRGSIAVDE